MPALCAGSACAQQVNNRYVTPCEDGGVIGWCARCYAADQRKRGGGLGIVMNPDKLCVQCGEKWAKGGMRLADGTPLRMCSGCAGEVGGSVASQQCTTPGCGKQIRWNVASQFACSVRSTGLALGSPPIVNKKSSSRNFKFQVMETYLPNLRTFQAPNSSA